MSALPLGAKCYCRTNWPCDSTGKFHGIWSRKSSLYWNISWLGSVCRSFFLQAPGSLRVKRGKFTQRQPQCNIPDIFWSLLSIISICTLSFRHPMLAVDGIHRHIHVLTAGGNVCPNEQQHKGLCCWVHRKLLQVSGTWFHSELQLLLFTGNSGYSCNCSHAPISPQPIGTGVDWLLAAAKAVSLSFQLNSCIPP